MFAAINMKEGGEPEPEYENNATTERGLTSHRSLVTHTDKAQQETSFAQVMRREAKLRLSIEEMSQVNERYATMFSGMKLNQPHNSAVGLSFAFLVRRLIFAMTIVLMGHMPQMATLTALILSTCMLAFIVVE